MKKLTLTLIMMLALVGFNANAAMYIVGQPPFGDWNPANGVEMTLGQDGTYTLDATLTVADIWFIFSEGIGDWDAVNAGRYDCGNPNSDLEVFAGVEFTPVKGNSGKSFKFSGTVGEKYTFTFNPTTMKAMVDGYVEPITEFTYTVAGNSADIFGTAWAPTETANDMTLDATDGLYKLEKDSIEIAAGYTLEYKVVQNHSWGTNWGVTPGGDNQTYTFTEGGTYNIVFLFDLENETVSLEATKIEDGPIVDPITGDFFILGQVNNNNWNPSTGIEMETADEDVFTLADANFSDSGDGYAYFSFTSKIGVDENDWSFGAYRRGAEVDGTVVVDGESAVLADWGSGDNAFKVLPGTYDVEVGLSSDYVKLTLKETPQPVIDDVYVFGDVNDYAWDPTQGVQMTYNEGIYTAEVNATVRENIDKAYIGFTKKLADAESETPWDDIAAYRFGPVSDEAFVMTEELLGVECNLATDGSYNSIALPEGTWTVTVDLVNNKFTVNGTWPIDTVVPEPYTGNVYIMGEVNDNGGWFTNKGVLMTRDAENNIYTATITTAGENIPEGEETGYSYFSFTKQLVDSAADWEGIAPYRFGAVSDGDYWVTDEVLGTEIALTNGGSSFRVPAGTWNLTLSVDNMTLVIEAVAEPAGLRGDVNDDGDITIGDVTALINALLSTNFDNVAGAFNSQNADCNLDETITIGDVTALINYLLSGAW